MTNVTAQDSASCFNTHFVHEPLSIDAPATQDLHPPDAEAFQVPGRARSALPASGVLHRIDWRGVSADGVPFAVCAILDAANATHRALACSRRFGDLSQLSTFEGLCVTLVATEHGLQLKPLAEQIPPEQQLEWDSFPGSGQHPMTDLDEFPSPTTEARSVRTLQELAASVAKLARDLQLSTCMWIHLP